ncbi:GNAT family N-acetyltransferase [Pedobacter sp. KR3-3]|uniref:GNAT family N-acetyltransferase n=1 Tax=Pedobacter albus TaxID=3113905 RepID=A0ABU7I2P7_9SPHI|nr:GNAT family N-acetyltransferase [Pedobacter sp. KR3-3]MEE1943742.1 GNAT family N-acetyltransferase [Pedobacter sp. KR3-3]
MELRKLSIQDIKALLIAINNAFADYIVPFQLNEEQLQFKIASEDIRLEWSVGVFEAEEIVAFIMNGVRNVDGKINVYNAGTGTLPAYRGQGLVSKMYDYILPFLKENDVKRLVLEVIEGNQSAIRAYQKNGFSIQRKLLCFNGVLTSGAVSNRVAIQALATPDWAVFQSFWEVEPSWQNAISSMDVIKPQTFGAFLGEELVGYALFNPINRRLYQLAVKPAYRQQGIATRILAEIQKQATQEKVQLNNVDEAAKGLKIVLEKQGLTNFINQFEMVREL